MASDFKSLNRQPQTGEPQTRELPTWMAKLALPCASMWSLAEAWTTKCRIVGTETGWGGFFTGQKVGNSVAETPKDFALRLGSCLQYLLISTISTVRSVRPAFPPCVSSPSSFGCVCIRIEGSSETLEVKLPTIWRDGKAEVGRETRSEKIRSEERRCRCAKRQESRDSLRFSNDLWLWRVEK